MILFAVLLAFVGIPHFAESSPPKLSQFSFQTLLDTCTDPENSNSKDCQYFISTYRWQYDDIPLVYDKVIATITDNESPAMKILENRLFQLIENPKFALGSLGKESFKKAIVNNNEPFANAIWPHLKKYQTESSDLQLQVCNNSLADIMKMKMLPLLKKMVTDRPDCFNYSLIIQVSDSEAGLEMMEFLSDQGAEFTPSDLFVAIFHRYPNIFEWAILKYRHAISLIYNVFPRYGYQFLSLGIWETLKENNHSELLNQLCNDKILEVVEYDKSLLLKSMVEDCPNCFNFHRDRVIDTAIRVNTTRTIQFLIGSGVEITPEQIQILRVHHSTDAMLEEYILRFLLSREIFLGSFRKYEFFQSMVNQNNIEICQKILSYNFFEIEEIKDILDNSDTSNSKDCVKLLQDYLYQPKNLE